MKTLSKAALAIILTFTAIEAYGQQMNIVVAIAERDISCNQTDLGYEWFAGGDRPGELKEKAVRRVKSNNPGYDNVESRDNVDWGSYMGSVVVIISGSTTNSSGCRRNTYGVGFGTNSRSALESAISHLSGRNWSWSQSGDGYSVVEERRF